MFAPSEAYIALNNTRHLSILCAFPVEANGFLWLFRGRTFTTDAKSPMQSARAFAKPGYRQGCLQQQCWSGSLRSFLSAEVKPEHTATSPLKQGRDS